MSREKENDSTNEPLIEMRGVAIPSQAYPDQAALQDVNWTVRRGEYWVIGGMHGSGKTDLIAAAAGIVMPLAGQYLMFGKEMPLAGLELLAHRLRMGLVFERGQLLQNITLLENITLPLRYHRPETDPGEVTAMLEATELMNLADRLPESVSRSWQKRAGLARALLMRPDILLVDNPLNGLDPRHSRWWMRFLQETSVGHALLSRKPMALVVTTEDLRPWRNFDAHFALVQNARFLPLGRLGDISGHSQPLVGELLAESSSIH